jgi:hypothetical protein
MPRRSRRKSKKTLPPRRVRLLRYEDAAALRRRALRRRLVAVLALLVAINLLFHTFGERAWDGAMTLFWQQRCLGYQLPDDRIAYVARPRGAALPAYLKDFSGGGGSTWDGTVGAPPYPVELAELQKLTAHDSRVPWDALPGPVFLHGLRDARGRQRLVTVYALANNPAGWWTIVAAVRDPVGLRPGAAPRPQPILSTACWPMPNVGNNELAVFAGQPDPGDPSRFTLRVGLNGKVQLITGVLQNDGSITFTSSSGLTPWDTSKAGPIVVPVVRPMVEDNRDIILLPTD